MSIALILIAIIAGFCLLRNVGLHTVLLSKHSKVVKLEVSLAGGFNG